MNDSVDRARKFEMDWLEMPRIYRGKKTLSKTMKILTSRKLECALQIRVIIFIESERKAGTYKTNYVRLALAF